MTEQHILRAFDRDLEAIQAMVMRMGGMVEAAILQAAEALEARDEDLAGRVRAADREIDALEEKINEEAARLIALRAPAASDRLSPQRRCRRSARRWSPRACTRGCGIPSTRGF